MEQEPELTATQRSQKEISNVSTGTDSEFVTQSLLNLLFDWPIGIGTVCRIQVLWPIILAW